MNGHFPHRRVADVKGKVRRAVRHTVMLIALTLIDVFIDGIAYSILICAIVFLYYVIFLLKLYIHFLVHRTPGTPQSAY
jgi:hypothetical protein